MRGTHQVAGSPGSGVWRARHEQVRLSSQRDLSLSRRGLRPGLRPTFRSERYPLARGGAWQSDQEVSGIHATAGAGTDPPRRAAAVDGIREPIAALHCCARRTVWSKYAVYAVLAVGCERSDREGARSSRIDGADAGGDSLAA